jgi:hypothetical protein
MSVMANIAMFGHVGRKALWYTAQDRKVLGVP